jgi:hypothetical protein
LNKPSQANQEAEELETPDEKRKKKTVKADSYEKKREAAQSLYLDRYD